MSDHVPIEKPGRYEWIDFAKGVCIALVVLLHTSLWYMERFAPAQPIFWLTVSSALAPMRMPLFFLISGLLASASMRRPLAASFGKTGGLYIIYCLWTGVLLAKFAIPMGRSGHEFPAIDQIMLSLILPTNLWYIWALPAFYLIAWGLRRYLGRAAIHAIVPAALLSIAAYWIDRATGGIIRPPFEPVMIGSVCANFIWFLAGLHGKDAWLALLARATMGRAITGTALFAAMTVTALRLDLIDQAKFFLTPFALFMAAQWLGTIRYDGPLQRGIAHLGRDTLPIYAMHGFALAAATAALKLSGMEGLPVARSPAVELMLPIAMTAMVILACMIVGHLVKTSPLRFMLEPVKAPPGFVAARARGEPEAADQELHILPAGRPD